MSKAETRKVIDNVVLSTGQGLSGQGKFVSGSGLVIEGNEFRSIKINEDNINISYLLSKHAGVEAIIEPNVHNLSIGSIQGPVRLYNSNNEKLTITLTGDNYSAAILVNKNNNCDVVVNNGGNGSVTALGSIFQESVIPLNKLEVRTTSTYDMPSNSVQKAIPVSVIQIGNEDTHVAFGIYLRNDCYQLNNHIIFEGEGDAILRISADNSANSSVVIEKPLGPGLNTKGIVQFVNYCNPNKMTISGESIGTATHKVASLATMGNIELNVTHFEEYRYDNHEVPSLGGL